MVNLKNYIATIGGDQIRASSQSMFDDMELYIYCPYCLDIDQNDTAEPTIVPTLVDEADEALGNKILADGSKVGFMVNDDYASRYLTYIITPLDAPAFDYIDDDIDNGGSGGGGGVIITPPVYSIINGPADLLPGINYPSPGDDIDFICSTDLIRRVYVSDVQLTEQLDPLIGFINSRWLLRCVSYSLRLI